MSIIVKKWSYAKKNGTGKHGSSKGKGHSYTCVGQSRDSHFSCISIVSLHECELHALFFSLYAPYLHPQESHLCCFLCRKKQEPARFTTHIRERAREFKKVWLYCLYLCCLLGTSHSCQSIGKFPCIACSLLGVGFRNVVDAPHRLGQAFRHRLDHPSFVCLMHS